MSAQAGLTPRMAAVLEQLKAGVRRGVIPTRRDMAAALGMKSQGQLNVLIDRLEADGYVRRVKGKHCSIEIVGGPWDLPLTTAERLEAYCVAYKFTPGDVVSAALEAFLPAPCSATKSGRVFR